MQVNERGPQDGPRSNVDVAVERRQGVWLIRALLAVAVAIHAAPSWRAASLPLEDGAVLFADHYTGVAAGGWFTHYSGYASVLPRVVASLLCELPVTLVSRAFIIATAVIAMLPANTILASGWRNVMAWPTRALCALLLAWLPLGDHALAAILAYSQTHFLLVAFLLLAMPADRARPWMLVVLPLLAWTHPLCVVLAPIAALQLMRRGAAPTTRLPYAAFLLAVAAYLGWGASGLGGATLPDPTRCAAYVTVRVFFESVGSTSMKVCLQQRDLGWLPLALGVLTMAGFALAVLRAWSRWSPALRLLVVACGYFGAATVVAAFAMRSEVIDTAEEWAVRYCWPARQCLVIVAVSCATVLGRTRWAVLIALVWFTVLFVAQRGYYRLQRDTWGLQPFLEHLAAEERRLGGRDAVAAELPRGDWPIRIVPKAR